MLEQITDEFNSWIKRNIKNEGVRNYLLQHERKNGCINKVYEQVRKAEVGATVFDKHRYHILIHECAKTFCQVALEYAEQQLLSKAEQAKRIHDADTFKRAEEAMIDLEKEATSEAITSYPKVVH